MLAEVGANQLCHAVIRMTSVQDFCAKIPFNCPSKYVRCGMNPRVYQPELAMAQAHDIHLMVAYRRMVGLTSYVRCLHVKDINICRQNVNRHPADKAFCRGLRDAKGKQPQCGSRRDYSGIMVAPTAAKWPFTECCTAVSCFSR